MERDSLDKYLEVLTTRLEAVNAEHAQLVTACNEAEQQQKQLLDDIDDLKKKIADLPKEKIQFKLGNEIPPTPVADCNTFGACNPAQTEPVSHFIVYGESMSERLMGDRKPRRQSDGPKEFVLKPLDKTKFPNLAALQEKHPITIRWIDNDENDINQFYESS